MRNVIPSASVSFSSRRTCIWGGDHVVNVVLTKQSRRKNEKWKALNRVGASSYSVVCLFWYRLTFSDRVLMGPV